MNSRIRWKADPIAYAKLRRGWFRSEGFRAITSLEKVLRQLMREQQDAEGGNDDKQVDSPFRRAQRSLPVPQP